MAPHRLATGALLGALGLSTAALADEPPALLAQARTLPTVTVSGQQPAMIDTPSSFAEFGGSLIGEVPASFGLLRFRDLKNEGGRSLSSAIRSEPSAADAYNTIGFIETLQVRGFVLDGLLNYRRNGLPVSNYMPFALESKDRIEVQKGLTGAVSGSASPGGVVNFVTKRAGSAPLAEINVDLSERGTRLLHADLAGRSTDGAFGWRLNLAGEQRRPHANDARGERTLAAAALDWRGPRGLRADVEAEVQNQRQVSVPGFGLLDRDGDGAAETVPPLKPGGVDLARLNLNHQPWSQPFDSRARVGTARIEAPMSEAWRASLSALWQSVAINDRLAFPDGCSSGPAYVYPGLCGNYDIDLYDFRSSGERRTTKVIDAALDGRASTGQVMHALRVGLRRTQYRERFPFAQAYNFVGTINALAPTPLAPDPTESVLNTPRTLTLREAYAVDAMSWQAWSLWAGARFVRVEGASSLTDGSEAVRFDNDAITPWIALARRLGEQSQVYASFSRGLELEAVPNRPAFVNSGAVLPPHRSRQLELGWRGRPLTDHSLSLALFRIDRPQADDVTTCADPVNDPPPCTLRVGGGRQARHRGVEAQWLASLSAQWQASVSAAWLDAELTRSADPSLVGKRPTNVPDLAASAALTWRPGVAGLALTSRLGYAGERAVTRDNGVTLPSWWQWDLWLVGDLALGGLAGQWRAGVDNVTDRRFWRESPLQSWGGIYLFPAQPRTLRAGVTLAL